MTLRADSTFVQVYHAALLTWDTGHCTDRLWEKDASLWTNAGENAWLGWLTAPDTDDASLAALAERLRAGAVPGATEILLIGMGGSSLGPEVISRVLGMPLGGRALRILDSTEPAFVRDALSRTDWARTMVVVASKSGSTLEPDVLLASALDAARAALGDTAPKHFIAITDPNSKLAAQASSLGFAAVVLGEPSIGGRYSALSPFGLGPAALLGIGLPEFMESARAMAAHSRRNASLNPGVRLGAFLAQTALAARDKCTLVLPERLAPLGAWIEQLVAESTGKNGVAILPIDGEPVGDPRVYGSDRAFVHVRILKERDAHETAMHAIVGDGSPVFTIDVPEAAALAGEFFRWEFATAVASAMLNVNPFDQPDVEASKVATRAVTDAIERGESPPSDEEGSLHDALSGLAAGDYVALLPFLPMFPAVVNAIQRTRVRIRDARRVATSVGFGPRFLHSTGQAHKGGPNTGVFIQLTADAPNDVPIPGRRLTFGAVVAAQAAGDRRVLRERGRRVVHVHLKGDLASALVRFDRDVAAALG